MPVIPIKLPASVYQRFLAEVPPKDRDHFATCALLEALDLRHTLNQDTTMLTQETPKAKRPPGRPPGLTREKRSLNLEPRIWVWLESQVQPGESFNDTCNRLLGELVDRGK